MFTTTRLPTRDAHPRHPRLAAAGLAAALLMAGACCFGQTTRPRAAARPAAPQIEPGRPSRSGPPTAADLYEVRIIFEELDEQVRIATAKLEPAALDRKRDIGRLQAILVEVDQQVQLLAAKIQRQQERLDQLHQDRASGAGPPPPLPYEPATRLQQRVREDQTRLESLTQQRSRLKQRLNTLYDQHVQTLLEAGLGSAPDVPSTAPDALDKLLQETLNP